MANKGTSLLPSILRIMLIFTAAVVFLLIVSLIILRITISGNEVVVPNVIGKSFVEATKILNENHLGTPRVEGSKYNGTLPQDYVIEQKPGAGHKVKSGREIKVFLSKGAEAGIVPRVIDLTVSEAEAQLQLRGLELGSIIRIHSEEYPREGIIIAHTPPVNATVQKGTKVDLLVSLGYPYIQLTMPDIGGMKLRDAEELLKTRGLKLGQIEREVSPETEEPDIILEQSPQPNDRIRRGAVVNVVVSSAEEL